MATEATNDAMELDAHKMQRLLAGLAEAALTSAEAFEVFDSLGALSLRCDIEALEVEVRLASWYGQ